MAPKKTELNQYGVSWMPTHIVGSGRAKLWFIDDEQVTEDHWAELHDVVESLKTIKEKKEVLEAYQISFISLEKYAGAERKKKGASVSQMMLKIDAKIDEHEQAIVELNNRKKMLASVDPQMIKLIAEMLKI